MGCSYLLCGEIGPATGTLWGQNVAMAGPKEALTYKFYFLPERSIFVDRMKKVWLLSCVLLLPCSCARYPQRVFRQAETMLNTQPDSARMLLESISPEQLKSRTSKARYGLLFTMAKDKSYQDDLDTTLIQASYDYYQRWGTKNQRMLSAYYLGVARQYYGQDCPFSTGTFHCACPDSL